MNNILRNKRKKNIKIKLKRYILLIFLLIMTTFAWITYSRILNTGVKIDIKSWDIAFFIDEDLDNIADPGEEKENPLYIDLSDLYPGMEEKIVKVIIQNNGETPTDILYTTPELNILGNAYDILEEAPEEGENYILKSQFVTENGISTLDFINEPERFPFKIVIEHTQEIEGNGGEGYLTIKVTWPAYIENATEEEIDKKDQLDTEWGYKVAKYLEDNIDNPDVTGAFHVKLRINAIGKPRTDYDDSFTAKVMPANYGNYVNYPIDLNEDGDFTNDWRIFYNNGNNVYLIAADYVQNSMLSENKLKELGLKTYSTYGLYWENPNTLNYTISSGDYMISAASNFTTTANNYKAVASLLNTNNWTAFIKDNYADYAIGGPTIEMWMRSWNALYTNQEEQLYCNNYNPNGYYMGTVSMPETFSVDLSSDYSGYENDLYFSQTTTVDECEGYWIASPSSQVNANDIICVMNSGNLTPNSYLDNNIGIRPIVCLKNTVMATQNENNIWEFNEN